MNSSLTINSLKLSDADFERVVRANPEWNFEQTAAGDLVVVPPTGGTSSRQNFNLTQQLGNCLPTVGFILVAIHLSGNKSAVPGVLLLH
jgi:Uma2 family endonuclease